MRWSMPCRRRVFDNTAKVIGSLNLIHFARHTHKIDNVIQILSCDRPVHSADKHLLRMRPVGYCPPLTEDLLITPMPFRSGPLINSSHPNLVFRLLHSLWTSHPLSTFVGHVVQSYYAASPTSCEYVS